MELWHVILTSGVMMAIVNGFQQIFIWRLKRKADVEDKASEEQSVITMGVMAMLEDRLLYLGTEHIERGIISASQYSAYERMYNAYILNNKNGTIKRIKEQIDKLEIRRLD
jgi:hypothetical protein